MTHRDWVLAQLATQRAAWVVSGDQLQQAGITNADGEYKANARVSGPITDKIGFSLVAIYGDYRGNIKNVFNDSWTDGYHRVGVRGKVAHSQRA